MGYDAILEDRFGMDTRSETAQRVFERVYVLLRERVNSDFGLFREPVPDAPKYCDFGDPTKFNEAQQQWQNSLCNYSRWTKTEQLDEYLTAPL